MMGRMIEQNSVPSCSLEPMMGRMIEQNSVPSYSLEPMMDRMIEQNCKFVGEGRGLLTSGVNVDS